MRFRLTPARRDFLTLMARNDLLVRDNGKRFLSYEIKGQINKKIARNNFQKFVAEGLIYLLSTTQERKVYRITPKGRDLTIGGDKTE